MSLRIFSALTLLTALTACGGNVSEAPEGEKVACAIGPGAEFSDVCTLELVAADEFVIHHPNGGFRRFVYADTGIVAASDGVDAIANEVIDGEAGMWEFKVGSDRYRLDRRLRALAGNE